jgi:2-dehydro-3-deoxygalactonokinase
MTAAYDWLAVDWGTTHVRCWAMAGEEVLDTREAPFGMATLTGAPAFAKTFTSLAAAWTPARRPAPVVVCGMAGAREGWHPAAYASRDADLKDLPRAAVRVPETAPEYDVRILPGLRQATPPDVMRGEETKLLGLVAECPGYSGIVVLPGTHTKWVRLERGRVARFHTAMTGDVFAAIAEHTVLRHTLADGDPDPADFAAAVEEARQSPAALLRRAFGLRAEALLNGLAPDLARARLSGWLTGLEVVDAVRELHKPTRVALVGDEEHVERYAAALAVFNVAAERRAAGELSRAGLGLAHARLFGGGA